MLSATVGSLADAIPGEGDLPVDGECPVETFAAFEMGDADALTEGCSVRIFPTFAWEESGFCEIASTSTVEGLHEVWGSEPVLSEGDASGLDVGDPLDATESFSGEWAWDEVAPPDTELPPDASGEGDGEPFMIRCFGSDPFVSQGDQDDGSTRERGVFEAVSSGESVATAPRIERGAPAVQHNGDFGAAALWFGSLSGVDADGARLPGGRRRTR